MKIRATTATEDRLAHFTTTVAQGATTSFIRWRFAVAGIILGVAAAALLWSDLSLAFVSAILGYGAALPLMALLTYFPARRRALALTLSLTLIPAAPVGWWIFQSIEQWWGWVLVMGIVVTGFSNLITAQRSSRPGLTLFFGFLFTICGLVMVMYQPWVQMHIHRLTALLLAASAIGLMMWHPRGSSAEVDHGRSA